MLTVEQREAALYNFLIQLANGAAALAEALKPVTVPEPTVAPVVNQAPATEQFVLAGNQIVATSPAAKPVAAPPRPMAGPPRPAAPLPNRVPQVDAPVRDSIAEITAVADAVARDKGPLPVVPLTATPVAAAPLPAPGASATPVTPDGMASREELANFKARAGKLMRDKLEKEGGMKNGSTVLRDYILKHGDAAAMEKIRKDKWEEILSLLEKATPAEAAAIVKG